ncbi:hypothetical protein MCEIIB161_00043 [Candidatus Planktophila dulcis]|uniref:hypothetical protein n=1 Tax=Candidatus Planktophila dulcis TaxID=1884914 RepID=UPI003CF427A8
MSTKTTFKRIALVAVAALGLGVLSVAPSSAALVGLTVTSTNGTATTAVYDSTTATTLRVTATTTAAGDSFTATTYVSAQPTTSSITGSGIVVHLMDTSTSTVNPFIAYGVTAATATTASAVATRAHNSAVRGDSLTVVSNNGGTSQQISANFQLYFLAAPVAGTYTLTTVVTPHSGGVAGTPVLKTTDIVVSAVASAALTASATYSTLSDPTATNAVATASATAAATLDVVLKNAENNTAARESVTATITGSGTIGVAGGAVGKSVVLAYTTTSLQLSVFADGTAGVGTITVSTPSVTFPTKSITFYAATPSTVVVSVAKPVIEASSVSTTDVVRATFKDSLGNLWSGAAYIYATTAAGALIAGSETPTLCTFDTGTDQRHECAITGKLVGAAKFKVISSDSVTATTNVTSSEVDVRAALAVPASFKLVFDKATYAPGEKARLSVVVLDAAGAQIVGKTYDAILAAGGITSSVAFSSGSDTLTATSVVVSASSSSTSGTTAGQQNYVVYMPMASGDVTVTATGSTGLPLAARVVATATASVVNSSVDAATDAANEATDAANAATDAALAAADAADAATAAAQDASDAVAALSATVAKLVASLKAQITSLTNLVIKIQKKVKA